MQCSERTESTWKVSQPPIETSPLNVDRETDVCVVGAGIVGMSVAYELARAGRRVIVLDDNAIGGGETAQTTAHLASALDDHYYKLEQLHGLEGARLAFESHAAAIDRIEAIVHDEGIDCDFERLPGYLFLGPGDAPELLDRELRAVQRAGCKDAERLPRAPLAPFDTGQCLRFPRQAQFHPLRYIAGLVEATRRFGVEIFTGTHVAEIHGGRTPNVVTSSGRTVRASTIVVATNVPVNDRVAIHTKQAPYRTFVVTLRLPRNTMAPALYWDTGNPYHYVRLHAPLAHNTEDALLIVGGEDHRTGHFDDAPERFARLESWARTRFSTASEVVHRWSGQVLEPIDGLAFIGRNPGDSGNVLIATGDSGNGMTHGVIAGMLLRDLVLEKTNPWEKLYDPSRKNLRAIKEYASNNLAVAASYADWLKPGTVSSVRDIAPGQGAVIQRGARKLAVHRDNTGALRVCSAVCPHLGGVVHWNSVERSWDCPAHGSRFSSTGEVLNGPALAGLKRVQSDDLEKTPKTPTAPAEVVRR